MEEPAYHRPKKGRPTEYAENTELLKTEIDAKYLNRGDLGH